MKVTLIGCGGMGWNHAEMLTNCGLTLTSCADADESKAVALAEKYGADHTTHANAALRRPDIDIVAISTPTTTHLNYVKRAAKAGKHIFCEKPFCRTTAECKEAMAAAKKAGVKLFVGHVVRYFHEFEAMKAQVDAGKIGKVGFVRLYRGGICPAGWFRDFKLSGGVSFDCSIHDYDWLRYAFGDVDRVYATTLMRDKPEPMDYAQATFRMKSGVLAHVIGTWAHPAGFQVKAEICGTDGLLQYDSNDTPLSSMARESSGSGPGMIVPSSPVGTSPYQREWQDFIDWIEGKSKPRVKPKDALEAVRMAEAVLESAKKGKPVKL
jgi:predicted dehydrogenase